MLTVGLLLAALALFWISTRQMTLWFRGLLWLGGAALLAWTGWRVVEGDHTRFVSVIFSALGEGDGRLRQALLTNLPTVAQAIDPMLTLFVVFGALLGAVALVAFTPGQIIEKLTRPIIALLAGAAVGGLGALCLVALGFGGYLKPRSYVMATDDIEVVDGDTFRVGDVAFRLDGIDAPERDQLCARESVRQCGRAAADHLEGLLQSGVVICERRDGNTQLPPEESFGRPVVSCDVMPRNADRFNVAERMVSEGWAVSYRSTDFARQTEQATAAGVGLWRACTLRPSYWRRNREARAAFESAFALEPGAETIGCG